MFKAQELLDWCKVNCEAWKTNRQDGSSRNIGHKFGWCDPKQHQNFEVRLFKHDTAYWIILASTGGGYGGSEKDWRFVNMGTVYKIEQVEKIITALGGFSDDVYSTRTLKAKESIKSDNLADRQDRQKGR